jgi:hypothetical protein
VQKNNEAYASDDEEGGSMWSVETLTQYLDKVAAPTPLCTGNKVAVQSTRPHRGNNNNNNKKVTRRGPAGPRR